MTEPRDQRMEAGSSVTFQQGFGGGLVQVVRAVPGSAFPASVRYNLQEGGTLTAVHGPLDVKLVPHGNVSLCR